MVTVKDLFENEELMNSVIEDITEVPEDTEVFYSVWALGINQKDKLTDAAVLLGEFTDPDEAIEYAENVTVESISEHSYTPITTEIAHFNIEVETVIGDPDDDDGGTVNIGTIYKRDLWLDGEYGNVEDTDPFIELHTTDYSILEDGTMKVSCNILRDFNKNDFVRVYFIDEPESFPIGYQIISKELCEDDCYYILELLI